MIEVACLGRVRCVYICVLSIVSPAKVLAKMFRPGSFTSHVTQHGTRPRTKRINRRMHDFIQVAWAIGNVAGVCKTKYRVSTPPYPKAILEVTLYPNPNHLKSRNGTWVAHLSALGCCASSTKGASEQTDLERVSSVVEASRASDVNVSRLLPAVCRATARVQ